jgi:hypothetical protein
MSRYGTAAIIARIEPEGEAFDVPELLRLRGELEARSGDLEAAEASLRHLSRWPNGRERCPGGCEQRCRLRGFDGSKAVPQRWSLVKLDVALGVRLASRCAQIGNLP